MKKRVLGLLALIALVVAGSFAWHRQHAPSTVADTVDSSPSSTINPETLSLERESIDAIDADNTELKARIDALQKQHDDAEQLIALKAARLATLENSATKP